MNQQERDQQILRRRLDVLALTVLPLRWNGFVGFLPDRVRREHASASSTAVGVGANGDLLSFYSDPGVGSWGAVTRTTTGARGDSTTIEVRDAPEGVHHVQPLPDGGFVLSASRQWDPEAITCQVYDADGVTVASGSLGDAVEHVLTTPSGQIWVGYFDENPRGVARFDGALRRQWETVPEMPSHFDCYALNVDGETAMTCAYTDFHLTRIEGDRWTDLGQSPQRSARALLVQGDRAVLIGGSQAEYDLLTPVRITGDGIDHEGSPSRLVMPDGLEVDGPDRFFCRGPVLHVVRHSAWYQLELNAVFA